MNSNSCGKGLVIFSITLVLGTGIASLFISDTETTQLPQTNITKKEVLVRPKEKKVCIKEYKKFDKWTNEDENKDSIIFAPLIQKKAELEGKLITYNSKKLEKELEKVEKEIERLQQLKLQKKYGFKDFPENKNLLYKENCYDDEF